MPSNRRLADRLRHLRPGSRPGRDGDRPREPAAPPRHLALAGSGGALGARGNGGASGGLQPANGNGRRPRLKKLRVALVVLGLSVLAFAAWVWGMMMAVASDLPALENRAQYAAAQNSVVKDYYGRPIATLTNNEGRILVPSKEIAPVIKEATVAIEDERFYDHRGIDFQGIGRALYQDVLSGSSQQGGSTITQQFVKNALAAQDDRTIFQKLRESALAYHLERQWAKDKILTQYLNSIYFGEGAYGIEAAARTYFGWNHPGCGAADPCASELLPWEAALLAGIISSPNAYSPRANPQTAEQRRDLVMQKMVEQGYMTDTAYQQYVKQDLPLPNQIEPPAEESRAPYFTSWLRQQLVDMYGAGEAFGGGLEITSTLDLTLQEQVDEIVASRVGGIEPTSAVVVLDNGTAGVRAMVGGEDYDNEPFNLATQGHRQPGSAFKPFTLVTALQNGITPETVFSSEPKTFTFTPEGAKAPEQFEVSNYEDSYLGSASLATATTYSDNSVYAEVGLKLGTDKIADTAHAMGIDSQLSTNPAMILGGLEQGVTPLEMAHAYETLTQDGQRVSGTLAASPDGPVAISKVLDGDDEIVETNDGESGENDVVTEQAVSPSVAATARSILETVVSEGTGTNAQTGKYTWGKTGTTDDNGDAWFVGATNEITVAVWVGHADSNEPMTTEYAGGPVDGGTIPALIFHDIVLAYEQLREARKAAEATSTTSTATETTSTTTPTTTTSVPTATTTTPTTTTTSTTTTPPPEESAPAPGEAAGGVADSG